MALKTNFQTYPINTPQNINRGYSIAFAATVIWSTTGIFIGYLTQHFQMPPLVLAVWRDSFVVLLLLLALIIFRPRLMGVNRRHLGYLFLYGTVLAIFNISWTFSVKWNGAGVATVLAYSSPAFTALLAYWWLKEDLSWGKLAAVSLSLLGCVLVSGLFDAAAWQLNPVGILTGAFSGLFYAFYGMMGRSASQRGLNPWTTLLYTFGFAALVLLVINLICLGVPSLGEAVGGGAFFWLGDRAVGWLLLLALAVPSLGGYGLFAVSLVYLPSSVASLIISLEPAFTAILAYFILGERMTALQLFGSLLILLSVIFIRIYEGRSGASA